MRFLVVSKGREMAPLPAAAGMTQQMLGWIEAHTKSGKMEQAWSFAGVIGGGGILNVESLEELNEIMEGFPFAPVSTVEIYPLVELEPSLRRSLERLTTAMEQMAAG